MSAAPSPSSLELAPENRILVHQSLATLACWLISSAPNVPEEVWSPRSVTVSAAKETDSTTTGKTIAREGAR